MTERILVTAGVAVALAVGVWSLATLAILLNRTIPIGWAAGLALVLFLVLFLVDLFTTREPGA